ncbi:MAG: transposase [Caldilineaceae bacterium]
MEPDGHALVPFFVRELDYLLRRLDDLDQLLKMERNHLQNGQAMPDMPQVVLADIEQTIAALQQQRADTGADHQGTLQAPSATANALPPTLGRPRHRLNRFYRFDRDPLSFDALSAGAGGKKQLTAFLGLDSQIRQSGTSVSGVPRISKRGDTQMRAQLYMCALGGFRGHNVLREVLSFTRGAWQSKKSCAGCLRSQNSPFGLGPFSNPGRL